ncbi:coiled-coil domain-containing protein 57 [Syngnathus typhle]|uniref:coiled-coil domain-containing protein 57 n=1 Tax=Syngnathus typhle TaxID=161592 RepID=UPI002A6A6AA0|nr:coiled-coil domain-containing protein 57 [Syngnathus typhle]
MVTATLSTSTEEDTLATTCSRMEASRNTRDCGLGDLEALVANKEREWKELHARRIHLLEDSLAKAKEECSSLSYQNQKLKEDFQYNLSILDEREKELKRYDVITTRAVNAEQTRREELSRLRIQVATLEEKQAKDAVARQEELRLSQNKAAQQRLQLEELRHSMTGATQKQTEEHERTKRRLRQMEGELARQKQEMTAACDKTLRRQEHEFNFKLDEMRAALLSSELKIKLLAKEHDVQSQARLRATHALKASEELVKQLQVKLQCKADLNNQATAAKEIRIKELEEQLKQMENKLKKQKEDHIKKHEEVARALKEKDEQLEAQWQAHEKQFKKTEKHIVKLKNDLEIQSAQTRSAQKDMAKTLEKKDDTIKRLRTDVTAAQTVLERHVSQTSNEMVAKNTQLIRLQNTNSQLRADLERSREEIGRYKQDVSAGLQREAALERARVQLELEWQERYDAVKAKHYLDNEQLIQDLTLSRDQAKAELSEKEKQLRDLNGTKERDEATQGLTPQEDVQEAEQISSLVEQNKFLRAAVSQMRKEMEDLGHLLPHPQTEAPAATSTTEALAKHPDISAKSIPANLSDQTQALKQEVLLLKARCRHLEEQLDLLKLDKPCIWCLEKDADSSALRNQVGRGTHVEPRHANIRDQVQQVRDEKLHLWQQQLNSALTAGAASGNVQSVKRNIALAHSRLKQAASYIARLSKEKQQLIQMGNCLRARITSAGLHEGIEPKRDSVTEEQGHPDDRLFALEQLQYKLTTQELQYAVRQQQMACTVAEHVASSDSREPHTSKLSDKTPTTSQQQTSLEVKTQASSEESLQSLKDIWEVLDHGLSSSICSEGEGELSRSRATAEVMVTGTSAPIHSRSPAELQQKNDLSKVPSKPPKNCQHGGAPGKISRIRNYNTKD